jgi:hypothetical protein
MTRKLNGNVYKIPDQVNTFHDTITLFNEFRFFPELYESFHQWSDQGEIIITGLIKRRREIGNILPTTAVLSLIIIAYDDGCSLMRLADGRYQ